MISDRLLCKLRGLLLIHGRQWRDVIGQNLGSTSMSKNTWKFKPTELRRIVNALVSMGFKPCGVEVGADGSIKVLVAEPEAPFVSAGVQP